MHRTKIITFKNLAFPLILILILIPFNQAMPRVEDYTLKISTMEAVDRNNDGNKDGIELFYILRKGRENIEIDPNNISCLEAYLYEDKKEEVLISFWRIEDLKEIISQSIIYLPLREGFAYNIYADKIVPVFLKIKIVFSNGEEIEAWIKDRLSFLSY